jgi:MFS family permease
MDNATDSHSSILQPSKLWTLVAPSLRSRNFRLFWIGQVVSTMGTYLQIVAEGWLIYDMTSSTFLLGVLGFIGLLPVLPISFLGGLIIDRVPRRKLLMVTQTGLLLQATIFGLLVVTGYIQVWHIIFLDFLLGAFSAIDLPARQTFLMELVGKDDLASAIALSSVVGHVARVLGYAASGVLIATVGAGGAMLLNAATYLAPIVALSQIRVQDIVPQAVRAPLGAALSKGLQVFWKSPALLGTLGLMAVVGGLGSAIYGMMPAFAEDVLKASSIGLGLLLTSAGLGSVLGTAVVARVGKDRRGRTLMVASFVLPLLSIAFAFSRFMLVACFLLLVHGVVLLVLHAMANTLVQVNVPDQVRGRVMSIYFLLNAGGPKVGQTVIGGLAEFLGLPVVIALSGVFSILSALGVYFGLPSVRRLD